MSVPVAVRWASDGAGVDLLDQRLLPAEERRVVLRDAEAVAGAIRTLTVRGAPAIGIAAAMGLAADAAAHAGGDVAALRARFRAASALLASTRPTAVNLVWALRRLARRFESLEAAGASPAELVAALREEATAVAEEDRAMCRRIGENALALFPTAGARILTHCNAGALATGGIGTALAPIYLLHERGVPVRVYADETRPVLQGSRLTAWELRRAGVDVTVLPDVAAGALMGAGAIDLVIVGADRVAANGDVANKIGTYSLAVLAHHHDIPFYVAAPGSTIDPATPTGAQIPIERRDGDEVRRGFGRLTAPSDVPVHAPAFDVTPSRLITAIVTDRGVSRPPYEDLPTREQDRATAPAAATSRVSRTPSEGEV